MVQGYTGDYVAIEGERTERNCVNRLDFKDDHFELNGSRINVEPSAMALRVGCHLVSYKALRRMVTLVRRHGPIEALDP